VSEFGGATFQKAPEAPDDVVVTRSVAETKGLQPEDLGALVFLLLLSPGVAMSGRDCAAGMRDLGWKMSDERFAKIAGRLMKAGHLYKKSVYNPATGRPQWCFWAYRNPANNPHYLTEGADAFSQVSGENREKRVSGAEPSSEDREKRVSPGRSRNPLFPAFGGNTAKSGFPSDGVSAGQSRNPQKPGFASPPPHPPEEVTTSSSLTSPTSRVPSQREGQTEEEGERFAAEDLAAAVRLLQLLPAPWRQGRPDSLKLAPLLLAVMAEQGWPSIQEVDQQLLMAQLTLNPGRMTNAFRMLQKQRIPNLALYEAVSTDSRARRPVPDAGACLHHPAFPEGDCPPCVKAERERQQREASDPASVDGAGLLAKLKALQARQNSN